MLKVAFKSILLVASVLVAVNGHALESQVRFQVLDSTYFGQEIGDNRLDRYANLLGNLRLNSTDQHEDIVLEAGGVAFVGNDQSETHVAVPEVYYLRRLQNTNWEVVLGRKRFDWSLSDSLWAMELWEPQFKWDALKPERQGILGLTLAHKQANWNFRVLVSPYFLPSQGPQFKVEDGKIESMNPWFDSPVDRLEFASTDKDIAYEIVWPNPVDVVQQSTVALWNRFGGETGMWLSAGFTSKPINKVHLVADAKDDVALNSAYDIRVKIYPTYVRQQVATLETGYQTRTFNAWLSYISDRPEKPKNVPDTWIQSQLGNSDILSASLQIETVFAGLKLRPRVSYLKIWEDPFVNKTGNTVVQTASTGLSRFDFTEAIKSELQTDWAWTAERKIRTSLYHIYSILEEGSVVGVEMNLAFAQRWQAQLSADVLGVDKETTAGFITRYQSNDRVQGSLIYVF